MIKPMLPQIDEHHEEQVVAAAPTDDILPKEDTKVELQV